MTQQTPGAEEQLSVEVTSEMLENGFKFGLKY